MVKSIFSTLNISFFCILLAFLGFNTYLTGSFLGKSYTSLFGISKNKHVSHFGYMKWTILYLKEHRELPLINCLNQQ